MTAPSLTLPATLRPEGRDQALDYLRSYFAPVDAQTGYTGSRFERLSGGGDRPSVADEFTADDLVAVTMLSVTVPARAGLEILERQRSEIRELLKQIPTDLDLASVEGDAITPEWPAWRLWTRLMEINGLGSTTVSKLLARKRPRLLPVYDSLVAELLQPRGDFWNALHRTLRVGTPSLQEHLLSLRAESGIGEDISPLRVFDVVAWRTAKDLLR